MLPDPRHRPVSAKEALQLLQISELEPSGKIPRANHRCLITSKKHFRQYSFRIATGAALLALLASAFALGRWFSKTPGSPVENRSLANRNLPQIDPSDMAKFREFAGLRVSVEGIVTRAGESRSGRTRYLNFGRRPGDAIALAFRTRETDTEFPMDYLRSLEGRIIRAEGVVENVYGALQIFISSRSQLEVR